MTIDDEPRIGTDDEDDPNDNQFCPGCMGGDKWPADENPWHCPVCDAEYWSGADDDYLYDQRMEAEIEGRAEHYRMFAETRQYASQEYVAPKGFDHDD